ncbi:MAG TPA: Tad domain-containing protein [Candidatus Dormibacteraeota bacterium]|nr:Tad domain-containing protein [Candidatus Dormibacteraeota bacterium]
MRLTTLRRMSDDRRGQSLVIIALAMMVFMGVAAIAVDQGLAMADHRDIQAIVDSASIAGSRQYQFGGDVNAAHYIATAYLAANLGVAIPSSCTVTSCADGPYSVGTYTFTYSDSGTILDVALQHQRTPVLAGLMGIRSETVANGARARPSGPTVIGSNYAAAALGGDFAVGGGGVKSAASGNVSGPIYANGSIGANNGPHAIEVPNQVTNYDGTACSPTAASSLDYGPSGNPGGGTYTFVGPAIPPGTTRQNVAVPDAFDSVPPLPPPATFTTAAAALDGSGNWKPGTYNGFAPDNRGKLNPGVYKLVNNAAVDLSGLVQVTATAAGTPDPSGAVAFVFDHTDTGDVSIDTATLNGFEGSNTTGSVDPQGTHNFVLYGGPSNASGANTGFQHNISDFGPGSSPQMTGIIYMPNSSLGSHGNPSYAFYGSVYINDFSLKGGGNGSQVFLYICGLNAIAGNLSKGGLTR